MIQTGGMKLHEFHICDSTPCAPAHRDAVAGGDIRIRGVQINLTRATGGERRKPCADGVNLAGFVVERIGTVAAIFIGAIESFAGD